MMAEGRKSYNFSLLGNESIPTNENSSVVVLQPSNSSNVGNQNPSGQSWSPAGAVPYGLGILFNLNRLYIKQQIEFLEVLTGCETQNRYQVFADESLTQQILYAKENTDCCTRNCYGPLRPFEMNITDLSGQPILQFQRPLGCGSCCFPCCLQSISILDATGQLLGTVEQVWTFWIPKYVVKDPSGEVVMKIQGPCCTVSCCSSVEFLVLSVDGGTEIGTISKKWVGAVQECCTDADMFEMIFPADLDVRMKAVLFGACMLIDFMFFERSKNNSSIL